jgi:hypothetical protein
LEFVYPHDLEHSPRYFVRMNLSVYSFADCGLHGHGRMFAEDPSSTATLGCADFAIVACRRSSRAIHKTAQARVPVLLKTAISGAI